MNGIITALISGLSVAVPSIIATVLTSKANNELFDYKINELKEDVKVLGDKVQVHNNFGIKLAKLEENINNIQSEVNDLKRK